MFDFIEKLLLGMLLLVLSFFIILIIWLSMENSFKPRLVDQIDTPNGTVIILKRCISYEKIVLNRPAEVNANVKQDNRH